ncbi:MAG: RrF2 family transcriptional regulator, partial [Sedimentisphaerales bacterium]|nr:RrF2 family transcriptional regulator [Sedimentisphaerales bacterium]
MKLSTRTRYGVRAVIELAATDSKRPVPLKVIAERQDISVKYLEQLMNALRSGGIVHSIRGAKGGYILAKPPNQIKLSEVFNCLEGPVITAECVEDEDYCRRAADCAARLLWVQVEEAIKNVLDSVTVQDLIDR